MHPSSSSPEQPDRHQPWSRHDTRRLVLTLVGVAIRLVATLVELLGGCEPVDGGSE